MAKKKWAETKVNEIKPKYINKILDVPSDGIPCYLIGTVFAEMKYKADVLRDVELAVQGHSNIGKKDDSSLNKIEQLRSQSYCDPQTDDFWLEDDSGRILISGDVLDRSILVTGIIVGLLGIEVEAGVFHAVDIVYPEYAPQRALKTTENDIGKLLICSGFNINEETQRGQLELLKEWVSGHLGDPRVNDLSQMLVAGNIIKATGKKNQQSEQQKSKNKYTEQFVSSYDRDAMIYADSFLENMCHSIPVTIMPGENDVVELSLPKQPIHHSLFRNSSTRTNFNILTNPSFFEIGDKRILSTSGETINDLMKYIIPNLKVEDVELGDSIAIDSRLRLIEDSLLWQHIAPTCPDTLWCYPFENNDPFVLKETPHVYIVGNQPKFETSLVELYNNQDEKITVRIISVPEFSETNQCILLDLETLECQIVDLS